MDTLTITLEDHLRHRLEIFMRTTRCVSLEAALKLFLRRHLPKPLNVEDRAALEAIAERMATRQRREKQAILNRACLPAEVWQ